MTPIRHTLVLLNALVHRPDAGRHVLEVRSLLDELRRRARSRQEIAAVAAFAEAALQYLRGLGTDPVQISDRKRLRLENCTEALLQALQRGHDHAGNAEAKRNA